MRVFKNLFGNGDKIHVNEIVYKDDSGTPKLLSNGIIVESGSNENGEYIRFADGTQICWKVENIDSGSLLAGNHEFIWSFPQHLAKSAIILN